MRLGFLAVASLFCAGSLPAADSPLLNYVMPEAKVVSAIDVDRVMLTPFGKFILSLLPAPDAGFEQFISVTGFDPRRDVHQILMASVADPDKKTGLLLLRGDFDRNRILDLLKAVGKTPDTYKGVPILAPHASEKSISQALAFLDDSTAAAGDLDSIKAAIDRNHVASVLDQGLSAKIASVSAAQDAWVVSIAPISSFAKNLPDRKVSGALQGDLMKAIEQSSGGIKFGSTIEISGELTTRSGQDATSLASVVQFFLNMAQMHSQEGQNSGVQALLQTLSVNTDSNAVKVSWKIPENELETLVKATQRTRSRL